MRRRLGLSATWFGGLVPLTATCLTLALTAGCVTRTHGPEFDPYGQTEVTVTNLVAASASNRIESEWLEPSGDPFRLGPGDRIDIELMGEGEGSVPVLVGPDGRIYFHLLSGQQVWGLTLEETRDLLERELARYVKNPKVAMTLREVRSKQVWVLGRLNTPGIYPLTSPMTVLEAIVRAGGPSTARFTGTTEELADLHHSFILRQGRYLPVNFKRLIHEGDTSQNVYLEPGDLVYLPSALSTEIYVLGAVKQPRAVAFKDQVTLASAIASAGGLLPAARAGKIVIVRGSLTEPQYATVNYLDIVKGRAPNVRLLPRDLVYVPDRPLQPLAQAVDLIINSFVRTVAANEGIRAAGGTTGVGVGITVGQ